MSSGVSTHNDDDDGVPTVLHQIPNVNNIDILILNVLRFDAFVPPPLFD